MKMAELLDLQSVVLQHGKGEETLRPLGMAEVAGSACTVTYTDLKTQQCPKTGTMIGLPVSSNCFCRCCISRDSSMCVCLELFCFNARNAQLDAGDKALVAALAGDA